MILQQKVRINTSNMTLVGHLCRSVHPVDMIAFLAGLSLVSWPIMPNGFGKILKQKPSQIFTSNDCRPFG